MLPKCVKVPRQPDGNTATPRGTIAYYCAPWSASGDPWALSKCSHIGEDSLKLHFNIHQVPAPTILVPAMPSANATLTPPDFDEAFRLQLNALFRWRRDVRRFRRKALPENLLEALLKAASLAPSVGLSQPWRFVLVEGAPRRAAVRKNFEQENRAALDNYHGNDAKLYAKLKLEGLSEAPVHLAVFCDAETGRGKGLGSRTMPETLRYSVVAAVQNLWLAARSHAVGVGWVSILDPEAVRRDLDLPEAWDLVAYLCLGYPQEEHIDPELERLQWEKREDYRANLLLR